MDQFEAQQAIEIMHMIYRATRAGHEVSFTPGTDKEMILSVDDAHVHTVTPGSFREISDDAWAKLSIMGTYRILISGEGLDWYPQPK